MDEKGRVIICLFQYMMNKYRMFYHKVVLVSLNIHSISEISHISQCFSDSAYLVSTGSFPFMGLPPAIFIMDTECFIKEGSKTMPITFGARTHSKRFRLRYICCLQLSGTTPTVY